MYRVMLVDDEQIILQGLQKVIPWRKYGCEVVATAPDGVTGAALVRQHAPDILFTDIRMPNCSGLTMLAGLKSEFPAMQVSVLTAYRDFDYAQQAIRLGVCRYLLKPSRMDEIEEAIAAMTRALEAAGVVSGADKDADKEEGDASSGAAGSFIVKAAIHYIEQHHQNRISLCDVAESIFVSQWHLSKLLNRFTGKSFFDLLSQARVERAQALLHDPALKVGEIAEMVGFSDVAHFSKTFKKLVGKSPVNYRAGL